MMFMMKFKAARLKLTGGIARYRHFKLHFYLVVDWLTGKFNAVIESIVTHEQSPLNKLDEDKENATKPSTRWGEKVK